MLHSSYHHATLRSYNSSTLSKSDLIYPIFLSSDPSSLQPIPSLPNQHRIGLDRLIPFLAPLVTRGLKSVLLFGVPDCDKDARGTAADDPKGPVILAIQKLRAEFPGLLICCDVCLCAYTSHGHCGILYSDGNINNALSIERLAQVSVSYAKAGTKHPTYK